MAGGSTLPKRALGRELRRLRERSGTSQAAAARAIEVSPQTIGRMEDGHASRPTTLQINGLCDRYGASDEERRFLLELLQDSRTAKQSGGGWWRAYADEIPVDFNHYLALEESARRVTTWQETLLPGLLQIPEYRREMIWTESPQLAPDDVERRIAVSEQRLKNLRDSKFELNALLSEAVLRHGVGGSAVMPRQLNHLLALGEAANINVRVVPFRARSLVGLLVRSFVFLEFEALPNTRLMDPPVVYVEGFTGSLYLERQEEVVQYRAAAEAIERVALSEQETRALIAKVAEEFKT
ncbi:helix-turn-helix domain-containing protein [Nocardia rhamnosiphila]